jgi:hypothetical protein
MGNGASPIPNVHEVVVLSSYKVGLLLCFVRSRQGQLHSIQARRQLIWCSKRHPDGQSMPILWSGTSNSILEVAGLSRAHISIPVFSRRRRQILPHGGVIALPARILRFPGGQYVVFSNGKGRLVKRFSGSALSPISSLKSHGLDWSARRSPQGPDA